jgi:hypothetical protein
MRGIVLFPLVSLISFNYFVIVFLSPAANLIYEMPLEYRLTIHLAYTLEHDS